MAFDLVRYVGGGGVTDEQLALFLEHANAMLAERIPEDPRPALSADDAALRHDAPTRQERGVAAVDGDGRWVGLARVIANAGDDRSVRVDLGVIPEYRRQGIGRALAAEVVALAAASGHALLLADTWDRVPAGAAFAEGIGATPGLAGHVNRLVLADVDRSMVRRWIDEGPVRAPGYELVAFDGRCPDDLVEGVADILNAMNDAPQDDLAVAIPRITPELFRAYESVGLGDGIEPWWLLARERSTGRIVGETDVRWHARQPTTVNQGFTVVEREHRGHALGKWLKATMLARLLADRPEVVDVRTSNADSNDAMLGINRALGFRPFLANTTWQVPVDVARERVAGAGGARP